MTLAACPSCFAPLTQVHQLNAEQIRFVHCTGPDCIVQYTDPVSRDCAFHGYYSTAILRCTTYYLTDKPTHD